MAKLCVNIWDDYYDEDCVPAGEKQETNIYIEDDIPSYEFGEECLRFLLEEIKKCHGLGAATFRLDCYRTADHYPDLENLYHIERPEILAENLTHEARESLLRQLQEKHLVFRDRELDIYSES